MDSIRRWWALAGAVGLLACDVDGADLDGKPEPEPVVTAAPLTTVTPPNGTIAAPISTTSFGAWFDVEGDVLAAGDFGATPRLFIYERVNGTWTLKQNVTVPRNGFYTAQNAYAYVYIQDGRVYAGDALSRGVVAYEKSGSSWVLRQTIQPASSGDTRNDGTTVVPGEGGEVFVSMQSWGRYGANGEQGRVYVYTKGPSSWSLAQTISPPGAVTGTALYALAAFDDTLVLGRNGTASVNVPLLVYKKVGSTWTYDRAEYCPDLQVGQNAYPSAVEYRAGRLLVTCYVYQGGTYYQRKTVWFRDEGTSWTVERTTTEPNNFAFRRHPVGDSVFQFDRQATRGAATNAGLGYLQDWDGSAYVDVVMYGKNGPQSNDYFGTRSVLEGGTLYVSALQNSPATGSGSIYWFDVSADLPCYADLDGDGFGDAGSTVGCPGGALTSPEAGDCDDADPFTHPGATEIEGNDSDEDCDGDVVCWVDADFDGARGAGTVLSPDACDDPGEANDTADVDCDDAESTVYPGATEQPGTLFDEDCDGLFDCYVDADLDGLRGAGLTASVTACIEPGALPGSAPEDCDEGTPATSYGVPDPCGGDTCPENPDKDAPGFCGCDYFDLDLDDTVGAETCVHRTASVGNFVAIEAGAAVHESAVIEPHAWIRGTASVGAGSTVGRRAVVAGVVGTGVTLSAETYVGEGAVIDGGAILVYGASVGTGVHVGPNALLGSLVRLSGNTTIGEGVTLGRSAQVTGATVGAFVDLGADVVVEAGATVSSNAKIAAGSVIRGGAQVGGWARLGRSVTVGAGARVGDRANIKANVVIAPARCVPDDASIRPGDPVPSCP